MWIVYHDTRIAYGKNPRTIVLHNVLSISESKPTSGGPAKIHKNKCDIVEIEFGEASGECFKIYLSSSSAEKSPSEASELMENLEAMRRALFVVYLQYPRYGEQIVLQRYAIMFVCKMRINMLTFVSFHGNALIRDHLVPSSTMTVIVDPDAKQYRITLLSSCHSSAICMERKFISNTEEFMYNVRAYWPSQSRNGFPRPRIAAE